MAKISDKLSGGQQIGLYALGFSMFGNAAISPALGALQAMYPDTPAFIVTMIGSLPSLFIVVGALISGAIMGKFVGYKTLAIVSLIVYGISGILPFWIHPSMEVVLGIRAITGISNGILFPIASAAILRCVQDKDFRATYLGRAQALGSGGAIVLTLGGGYLGAISGEYTFLVYILAFICLLVVVVFMKEPPTLDEVIAANPEYQAEAVNAKRVKLPGMCWVFLVMFAIYQMCQAPVLMTIPLSLPPEQAGQVGVVMSFFTIGSFIIASFVVNFIKIMGRLTCSFFWILGAIGMLIVVFSGGNLIVVGVGAFVLGFAIGVMVMTQFELSQLTTPAGMAFAASLVMIATNLGMFFSSYWFGLLTAVFGENIQAIQASGAVAFVLMAIIWAILDYGPNKKAWAKKNEALEAEAK